LLRAADSGYVHRMLEHLKANNRAWTVRNVAADELDARNSSRAQLHR
jgi:hypothetical protein